MAIIQIKRRTSSGSGPMVGSSGTVKAGEPLVDFTGGSLYIAKKDKTATSANPLALADYVEYASKEATEATMNLKISGLSLGTASKRNTGTTNGTIPLIGADGKIPASIIPNVSPVTSVNSKTGAVTITLAELGGVSTSSFNSHINSNLHLTDVQRTKLNNVNNVSISQGNGANFDPEQNSFNNRVLSNALLLYNKIDTTYTPNKMIYQIGIDSTKVLTPTSVIDGGTY